MSLKVLGLAFSVGFVRCLQRALPAFVPGLFAPPSLHWFKRGKFIQNLSHLGHKVLVPDVGWFGIIVYVYGYVCLSIYSS